MSTSETRAVLCLLLLTTVLTLTKFADCRTPQRSFDARMRSRMLKGEAERRRQMTSELEDWPKRAAEKRQLQSEFEDWPMRTATREIGAGKSNFLLEKLIERQSRQNNDDSVNITVPTAGEKQCNLTVGERLNCGEFGMSQDDCLDRGCCWSEIEEEEVPWCYYSETALVSECSTNEETRVQCGSSGIRDSECADLGCCWRPTGTSGTPWCYHRQENNNAASEGQHQPTPTCGVPAIAPNVNLRIVGGVEATAHSWPWQVSMLSDRGHMCGGSLINNQWILSAAHCGRSFEHSTKHEVILGLHSQSNPDSYSKRVEVSHIIRMEKFGRPGSEISNDIMLLKLAQPVNFTDAISPVCLPSYLEAVEPGRRCYTSGWGRTEYNGEVPDKLQQLALPVIDRQVCAEMPAFSNAPYSIDDTMICAGYSEGQSSCHGDSGGPLVCFQDDHWVLYGIVSWGIQCARSPGLYGRVSGYINWINNKMNEHSN